jgi:hypothetical protein
VGRGYSFEALRAKILFTEGVLKAKRPPFERRRNQKKGKTMVSFVIDAVNIDPTEGDSYGAAISTLHRLLEQGRF